MADTQNTKKIINNNEQMIEKNLALSDTIDRNFKVMLQGQISGDVNKNIPLLNGFFNSVKEALGNDPVAAARLSNGTILQEFANLISVRNAQGTTVSDKELAEKIISPGSSISQQKAQLDRLRVEALNIRGALEDQNKKLWTEIDPLEKDKKNINRQSKLSGNKTAPFKVRGSDGKIYDVTSEKDMQPGDIKI
jgi:hypothetical protein